MTENNTNDTIDFALDNTLASKQNNAKQNNKRWTNIKDYVKCVYANKATLVGYIGAVTSGVLLFHGKPESQELQGLYIASVYSLSQLSSVLLGATKFGRETFQSYRRAKKHIQEYETINTKYYDKHKLYCDKVGVRLAAREAGLEDKLK